MIKIADRWQDLITGHVHSLDPTCMLICFRAFPVNQFMNLIFSSASIFCNGENDVTCVRKVSLSFLKTECVLSCLQQTNLVYTSVQQHCIHFNLISVSFSCAVMMQKIWAIHTFTSNWQLQFNVLYIDRVPYFYL